MEKNKSQLAQNKSLKGEFINPFPFFDQRKPSLSFEEQQRYFFKNKIMANHEGPEPPNEKVLRHQICFLYPKDLHGSKKRAILTPKKIEVRQKLYQTLEECIMKKQLEAQEVKRSIYYKETRSPEKEVNAKAANEKSSNRACIYQSFKKSTTNKDKLKPISITNKSGLQSQFLNVEKIILMEGDRSKKNHIIAFNQCEKQKIPGRFGSHKLMREVSLGKEIFNGARLLPLNESSANLKQEGQTDQTYFPNEQESPNTENIKIQQENVGMQEFKIKKEIQLLRKKKSSPLKRSNRRKLNIPFETYYYRDMLWKVNYSNDLYIQSPIEYEHRLKVHVGKGNNSCMVNGLISRRPYFAITDKVQQANFVWTQIKVLQYYKTQQDHLQVLPQSQQNSSYQSSSLLTTKDIKQYNSYIANYFNTEEHCDQRLISRSKAFKYRKYIKSQEIKDIRMHNHLINNYVIGNKKALFNTMANYYKQTNQEVFDFLPLTFHIKDGMEDKKYFQFLKYYHKRAKQIARDNEDKTKEKQYNAWIVKPGQNSNRGNGIKMCLTLEDIKSVLKKRQVYKDGTNRTYIVQAYIQRPLLYFKRKFDLRHYIMITCVNGIMKGYWYKDGYVRTTSSQYSLKANDGSIHLTNDAVQKNLPDYGKYEKGNKISYDELNAYIEKYHKKSNKGNFYETIYPKMKRMATDAMRACSGGIDPSKKSNNFEVFGMDFMIDANLDVWLIEINSNPCLELSCPLLASLIPKMVENSLQLTLDAMFPPPVRYSPKGIHYFKQLEKQNKFELVYDQRVERLYTGSLEVLDNKLLEQEDDTFEDCGDEWEDN